MGGKHSKVKTAKKGKSKSKNKSIEDLTGPEGKYEEQPTLPRPDYNLEENGLNVPNGGKLEITVEGDTSMPNADIDLETAGDTSAVTDNLKNSAQAAANNVNDTTRNFNTTVAENADNLAEKSNMAVEGVGQVSEDVQRSADVAKENVVEGSQRISQSLSQNVDGVVQSTNDAAEETGRVSGEFRKSAQDVKDNVVETSHDISSSFSQNVDGLVETSNSAVEETGRISGEFQKSAHVGRDNVEETSHGVSMAVSQNIDGLAETSNDAIDTTGRISGDFQKSAQIGVNNMEAASHEASMAVSKNVDGLAETSNDAVETTGRISGDFQRSAQGVSASAVEVSQDVSSTFSQNVNDFEEKSNETMETTGQISGDFQKSVHGATDEAVVASNNVLASFSHKVDEVDQTATSNLESANNAIEESQRSTETAALSASENVNGYIESSEAGIANAGDFIEKESAAGVSAVGAVSAGAGAISAGAFTASVDSQAEDAPFVKAYDDFLAGSVQQFVATSSQLGGDIGEMGQLTKACFISQRDFLVMASQSKEPSDADLPPLLTPLSEKIQGVTKYTETHRSSKAFNHLSAVSSGIGALGWVSVKPTPGPFVKDMMDSSLFYSNKVLKEFRGVNETQVQWCKSLTGIFTELMAYIKQFHTTGVAWNPQGGAAKVPSGAPSAGGAPPPPPPPPPPVLDDSVSAPSSGGDDGRAELFAALNKGEDVTKGLKKVSDDMKTHKNPGLRQGPAPFKPNKSPISTPKGNKAPVVAAKPPKFQLEGKKWLVEHQSGNNDLKITETDKKHIVYVYKCQNSSVTVKGKVNSVIVDGCKKVGVVVDDVISSIEFVNCQSVKGQILGKAPTVSIDKTDGCMVYLSKDSLDANIVTAKSSEMNILVPADGDADYKEFPVPEQFKTTWNGKALVTEATDIAG